MTLALLAQQQDLGSYLPASALWSAVGLAVGYGAGRAHCWLAKMEHRRDDDEA